MKKIFSLLIFLFIIHSQNFAQCNNWLEASEPTNHSSQGAWRIATDQYNNVYSTGVFDSAIAFGNTSLVNLYSYTSYYLNKFNTDGVVQWAKQFEVFGSSFAPVIAQKNDFIYIAGVYYDTIRLNSTTILSSPNVYSVFLAKFDLNGNLQWAKNYLGTAGTKQCHGITINSLNQLCITGRFKGTIAFDSHILTSLSSNSAYLFKTDLNGNVIWAVNSSSTTSSPNSRAWGITTDKNNNEIITGYLFQNISFGSVSFTNTGYTGLSPYWAKFDSAGVCQWIHGVSGPSAFSPSYSAITDSINNIYIAGVMDTAISSDGNNLDPINGVMFYCKYSPSGNLIWVKQTGNSNFNVGQAPTYLQIDISSRIWMTGWSTGTTLFAGYSVPDTSMFLLNMDLDGNIHGAIGAAIFGSCYQSAFDSEGSIYVGGSAIGTSLSFQGNNISYPNDSSKGDFILKYCPLEIGIPEVNKNEFEINIYPNPTTDKLTIEIPSGISPHQIEITDALGRKIYTEKTNLKSVIINLKSFPSGIYFIKVQLADGSATVRKFVKE